MCFGTKEHIPPKACQNTGGSITYLPSRILKKILALCRIVHRALPLPTNAFPMSRPLVGACKALTHAQLGLRRRRYGILLPKPPDIPITPDVPRRFHELAALRTRADCRAALFPIQGILKHARPLRECHRAVSVRGMSQSKNVGLKCFP